MSTLTGLIGGGGGGALPPPTSFPSMNISSGGVKPYVGGLQTSNIAVNSSTYVTIIDITTPLVLLSVTADCGATTFSNEYEHRMTFNGVSEVIGDGANPFIPGNLQKSIQMWPPNVKNNGATGASAFFETDPYPTHQVWHCPIALDSFKYEARRTVGTTTQNVKLMIFYYST